MQKVDRVLRDKYNSSRSTTPSSGTTAPKTTAKPAVVPKSNSTTSATKTTNTYNQREFETQTRKNQKDFKKTTPSSTPSSTPSPNSSFETMKTSPDTKAVSSTASSANNKKTNRISPPSKKTKPVSSSSKKTNQKKNTQSSTAKKSSTVTEKYRQYHAQQASIQKIKTENNKTLYTVPATSSAEKRKNLMYGVNLSDSDHSTEQYFRNKMSEAYQGLELSSKVLGSPVYKKGIAELGNIAPENETLRTLKEKSGSANNWIKVMMFGANYTAGEFGDGEKAAKARAELIGYLKRMDMSKTLAKGSDFLENVRDHGIIGMSVKEYYKNTINEIKNQKNKVIKIMDNGFYYNPDDADKFIYRRTSEGAKTARKGIEVRTNKK